MHSRLPTAVRAGLVASLWGLILGLLARLAMRFVALESGLAPGLSLGGSLEVVAFGLLVGTPAALAFFTARRRMPTRRTWPGAAAGLTLFLMLAVVQPPAARSALEGTPDTPAATAAVFAAILVGWGLSLELAKRLVMAALMLVVGAPLVCGQAPEPPRPLVWVLSTGGTISGTGASSTSLAEYKSGALLGEELVAAVPEIKDVADVRVEQIANVSSTDITLAHWLTLANRINEIFDTDPRVSGVVVTHGTNTLEETAYFLNLTVKHDRPVVMVGAMRPASAISADGPLNLLNGIRTAVSKDAVGKGTLVVLNEEVNGARDVSKTNTYRVETFRSPELGLLGYVDADRVAFYRASLKRHTTRSEFDVRGLASLPPVEILYSYVQPTTILARALATSGTQGIVFAGTGAGLISTAERAALAPLLALPAATRPVFVRSNRTGNGRVVALADYDALGMIPGDNLTPQKARILLMLGLTKTRDVAELRRMFAEY